MDEPQDQIFEIKTPSGHLVSIRAADQETALAGAEQWHTQNSGLMANAKDFVKSIPQGLAQGVSNVLQTFGPAAQYEMNAPGTISTFGTPDAAEVFGKIKAKIPNAMHEPTTPGGEWGQSTGRALPMAVATAPLFGGNPFNIGQIATQTAAATGGSQLGGYAGEKATEGTSYAPYGKTVGSLVGGVAGPYAASKAIETGAKVAGHLIGGMGTGAGKDTLRTAFESGVEGGDKASTFRGNMRGEIPPEAMANDANKALGNLYRVRSANYEADAQNILNKSNKVVGYTDIDKALADAKRIGTFEGVSTNPSTKKTQDLIQKTVDYWRGLGQQNPKFSTPAGMVGLKQRLGDIRDNLEKFSPQWKVADEAYHSVSNSIEKQVPEYAKMTRDYALSTTEAENLKKTFSLGDKATPDTAIRKLQSVARDGANTNYGARANLARVLEENGAPNLTASVAGQASNSWLPRGLARMVAEGGTLAAGLGHAVSPFALLAAPITSPRLTGEAAHFAGRAADWANIPQALQSMQSPQRAAHNLAIVLSGKDRRSEKLNDR